jgi:hypothetical protein
LKFGAVNTKHLAFHTINIAICHSVSEYKTISFQDCAGSFKIRFFAQTDFPGKSLDDRSKPFDDAGRIK